MKLVKKFSALTVLEKEVMRLLCRPHTPTQVGKIIGISTQFVKELEQSAKEKLLNSQRADKILV